MDKWPRLRLKVMKAESPTESYAETRLRPGDRVTKAQPQLAPPIRPLDKSGFIPLYYQIQRALMEKISSGELSTGDPLASEEELARIYQVSRMTARQAL